ncbi:hypothetical protein JCM30471_25850 [Desulfuromonas carbonis]
MIPIAWNRCSNHSELMNLVCVSMILCSAVKSFSGLPGNIFGNVPESIIVKAQMPGHGEIRMGVGNEWIGLQGLIMAEVRSVQHEA